MLNCSPNCTGSRQNQKLCSKLRTNCSPLIQELRGEFFFQSQLQESLLCNVDCESRLECQLIWPALVVMIIMFASVPSMMNKSWDSPVRASLCVCVSLVSWSKLCSNHFIIIVQTKGGWGKTIREIFSKNVYSQPLVIWFNINRISFLNSSWVVVSCVQ